MISFVSGVIRRMRKDDSRIVVEVGNGLGYEILLPYFVKRSLVDDGITEGSQVELETYYYVTERQPRPMLIGFRSEAERSFFERLMEVGGVGPTVAARAMIFSVSTIAGAIENEDIGLLTQMPGLGERKARHIVATLRGKVAAWALLQDEGYASVPPPPKEDYRDEAIEVLVGLGYQRQEARGKVDAAQKRLPKVEGPQEIIREVFRAEKK